MIQVENLKFSYRPGHEILNIAEFKIAAAEKIFLFGPSGSGKTTLLGILTGILKAAEGSVSVGGSSIDHLSQRELDVFRGSNIGYIFQSFNLLPFLSVRENILLPLRMHPARRQRVAGSLEDEVLRIAKKLGIEKVLNNPAVELSVGQAQRAAAARALIGSPSIIIADEPTSSLDTDHREKFIGLLLDQARETKATVLFVSHDRGLAPLFDRALDLTKVNHAAQSGGLDAR